jgi:hypothetical protein
MPSVRASSSGRRGFAAFSGQAASKARHDRLRRPFWLRQEPEHCSVDATFRIELEVQASASQQKPGNFGPVIDRAEAVAHRIFTPPSDMRQRGKVSRPRASRTTELPPFTQELTPRITRRQPQSV